MKKRFLVLLVIFGQCCSLYALEGALSRVLWQRWDVFQSARLLEESAWDKQRVDIIRETPSQYFVRQRNRRNVHSCFDCLICHKEKPGPDSSSNIELNAPGNEILFLCGKCHQRGGFHPFHAEPRQFLSQSKTDLPLPGIGFSKGYVVCTTCHDVHAKNADNRLLREIGPDKKYRNRQAFCLSCHENWRQKSFHRLERGMDISLCFACHAQNPFTNSDNAQEITFDLSLNCNFCHDSLADRHFSDLLTKPKEVVLKNPAVANLVVFRGNLTCIACHVPHTGKYTTPALLRQNYFQRVANSVNTNPHRYLVTCAACHGKIPQAGDKPQFTTAQEINQLCTRCHINETRQFVQHPVGMRPQNTKFMTYNRKFRLLGRRMTCLSCHDLDDHQKKAARDNFIRGSYRKVTQQCDKCHNRNLYQKVNPHRQIDSLGKIIGSTCNLCHIAYDEDGKELTVSCSQCHVKKFNLRNLNANHLTLKASPDFLCILCHEKKTEVDGVEHLGKRLDGKMLSRVEKFIDRENINLPLGDRGRVFCVTCHYQHQVGILKGGGAPRKYQANRLIVEREKLCQACHE